MEGLFAEIEGLGTSAALCKATARARRFPRGETATTALLEYQTGDEDMNRLTTTFLAATSWPFRLCERARQELSTRFRISASFPAPSNGGSYPTAMNSSGEVVGYGDIYTDYSHAFLYNGTLPLINLGSFGGDYSVSVATGINNGGIVVGYSDSGAGGVPQNAFIYTQNGGMQNLGAIVGGGASEATAINNAGQIIGWSNSTSTSSGGGFLYSGGAATNLGSFTPYCINDAGEIVAAYGSYPAKNTYISNGGTSAWVSIGSLGGETTQPEAINAGGEIVGYSTTTPSGTDQAAFLYSDGRLDQPGGPLAVPTVRHSA